MRVEVDKDEDTTAAVFPAGNLPPETLAKIDEIRRLLRMPEGLQKFNLVYSLMTGATNELAVGSRSMFQIMIALASYTDVPEKDMEEQRAVPSFPSTRSRPGRSVPDQVQPGKTVERLCRGALPQ